MLYEMMWMLILLIHNDLRENVTHQKLLSNRFHELSLKLTVTISIGIQIFTFVMKTDLMICI